MKRFMIATALVSVMSTGAFAAGGIDTATINQYIPEIDVSTLTNEQVGTLIGIAGSSDESQKEMQMRAYLDEYVSPSVTTVTVVPADSVVVTEAPMVEGDEGYYKNTILSYLPDVDFDMLSDEEKAELISIATTAGSQEDKSERMRAYLDAPAG